MPEPEFEAYLSLLSKLLHLSRTQQAEIAAELRDHLEERLRDLTSQGHNRERAIALALEELGDSAALAVDFTHPYLARRRRQLMRYSLGSIAIITATFVLAAFYWPAQRHDPTTLVIAQAPPEATTSQALLKGITNQQKDEALDEDLRRQVEKKLSQRDVPMRFEEMPLSDVLEYLGDQLDLDFVIDRKYLDESGIPYDTPITLKLRAQSATVRTSLELMFRQFGELSYVIRDGVVLITSPEEGLEVQVYDCRDLLANVKVDSASVGSGVVGGPLGGMAAGAADAGGLGGGAGGLGGGGIGVFTGEATSPAAIALLNVIKSASGEQWLTTDGSGGTITEFDGLVIVRHSQRAHRSIEDLLTKMREKKARTASAASANAIAPRGLPAAINDPRRNPFGGSDAPASTLPANKPATGSPLKQ